MPTPKKGPRLGAGPKHQKHMLANLARDLFTHGRIRTTHAKARTLRPYAERLITKAKRGDLHARRQVLSTLRDRDVVAYLFEDVAPRFADRPGGYTRILKLGPRPGDNAPMALIELVEQGSDAGEDVIEESKQRRSRGLFGRRRRRGGDDGARTYAGESDLEPDDDASEGPDTTEQIVDDPVSTPPDQPAVGAPAGPDDEPDAGLGTGKDAGGA